MVPFIKILLLIFYFCFNFYTNIFAASCHIKIDKPIISFSGPISTALYQLGLYKDPNLKGVLSFHQFLEGEYRGKIFLGGIYLSKKEVQEIPKGTVVFYDASQNLKKLLQSEQEKLTIKEIDTRNRDSLELSLKILDIISPLVENCENEIKKLIDYYQNLMKKIEASKKINSKIFFFMGKISVSSLPDYLVGNDLFLRLLNEKSKLESSVVMDLPYVPWSSKILNEFPIAIKIGLVSQSKTKNKIEFHLEKVDGRMNSWNLYHPGILVPGAFQLEVAIYILNEVAPKIEIHI